MGNHHSSDGGRTAAAASKPVAKPKTVDASSGKSSKSKDGKGKEAKESLSVNALPSAHEVCTLLCTLFPDVPRDLSEIISQYSRRFWDPRVYLTTSSKICMFGTAGSVYLAHHGDTNDTTVVTDITQANVVTLYVRPVAVPKGYITGNHSHHQGHIEPHTPIQWHEEFYFTTQPVEDASAAAPSSSPLIRTPSADGASATTAATQPCRYLERGRRITTETVNDAPHYACRFSLGFVTTPTQSWICDRDPMDVPADRPVTLDQILGLRPIGTSNDPCSPAYHDTHRRWLTLRGVDASSIVVANWRGDERIILRNIDQYRYIAAHENDGDKESEQVTDDE